MLTLIVTYTYIAVSAGQFNLSYSLNKERSCCTKEKKQKNAVEKQVFHCKFCIQSESIPSDIRMEENKSLEKRLRIALTCDFNLSVTVVII